MRTKLVLALVTLVMAIGIFFVAAVFAIVASIMIPGDKIIVPAVFAFAAGLFALACGGVWRVKNKKLKIAWLVYIAAITLITGVYEGVLAYDRSIQTVSEGQLDLKAYEPFADDSLAVDLGEPPSLRLDKTPRIDGSTALYPLYSAFVRATCPEGEYSVYDYRSTVRCTGTGEAYARLLKGEVDVIFVSPPSKAQREDAAASGKAFALVPIGREAFVFFVNAGNRVDGLTSAEIRDVYAGRTANWSALGGRNEPIRAFQRPENSGSQTALQSFMAGDQLMPAPNDEMVDTMAGMIRRTSDYKNYGNAIGFSFLYYTTTMVRDRQIKLLAIDGVAPERASVRSGQYPLSSDFCAVTLGEPSPDVQALIAWTLSPQGQLIIEKTGYCPLAGP